MHIEASPEHKDIGKFLLISFGFFFIEPEYERSPLIKEGEYRTIYFTQSFLTVFKFMIKIIEPCFYSIKTVIMLIAVKKGEVCISLEIEAVDHCIRHIAYDRIQNNFCENRLS